MVRARRGITDRRVMICRRSTAGISLRCEPHAEAWGYMLNSFHEQVATLEKQ